MARRPDPERIYQARRAADVSRLEGDGELPDRQGVGRPLGAHAGAEGKPRDLAYWNGAWDWIAAQRGKPAAVRTA
ncbi:MAG: hypothetical protein QOI02_656 [Actinomycetota bacterium]|nr:hypothetical protein [Actinomycetota bacterium]